MKCSKCGQEYTEGTKFCEHCGADLTISATTEAPAAEVKPEEVKTEEVKNEEVKAEPKKEEAPAAEPKKENAVESAKPKMDLKKILVPVAAIAAILVVICLLGSLMGGKAKYPTYNKNTIVSMQAENDTLYALNVNGEFKDLKVEKKGSVYYSGDRSTAAFLDDSEELVIYRNGKVIATGLDDVKSIVVSNDGSTVAYLSEVKNGNGTLYLYDTKSKKAKEVTDDARTGTIVLSPNGKTVAFVGDYDGDDDFKGYYSVNGKKPVEVGKEKRVFAIADKAAYVYYKDGDRIYVQKGKKDGEKLATDISSFRAFFNADMSQIMFTSDGKTYISEKAKEKVKVSGEVAYSMVLPQDHVVGSYNAANGTISLTGLKSFAKQLVYMGNDVYYVKPNFESVKVASGVSQCALSKNGKTLLVLGNKKDVIEITDFAKGGKKKDLTGDGDVEEFATDLSCKKIYVVNEDDELLLVKSNKKTKKISDDVTSYAISKDGSTCYFVVEGETLYFSKNGGKKTKVKEADRISCVHFVEVVEAVVRDDDTTIYYTLNGKKMKEVFKSED